ncbi:MAG: hypothetical protein ACUVSX_10390 [Aggregatilineales bacterium]
MSNSKRAEQVSGGVLLIGLALLFMGGIAFCPGILYVIGASVLARAVIERSVSSALNSLVWLFGLAFLFTTDWWWPGIVALVGLSMVLSAIDKHDKRRCARLGAAWSLGKDVFEKRKNEDLVLNARERFYVVDDEDCVQAQRR